MPSDRSLLGAPCITKAEMEHGRSYKTSEALAVAVRHDVMSWARQAMFRHLDYQTILAALLDDHSD